MNREDFSSHDWEDTAYIAGLALGYLDILDEYTVALDNDPNKKGIEHFSKEIRDLLENLERIHG